jgi:hypothetical protein
VWIGRRFRISEASVTRANLPPVTTPPAILRRDIEVLRDLSHTVPRSHEVVGEAFWDKLSQAANRDNPPLEQKILVARLAAESISATEDLGALAWAIANRAETGVVDAYLSYRPGSVRVPFRQLKDGDSLLDVLRLPRVADVTLLVTPEDSAVYAKAIANLEATLKVAAGNYLRETPNLVKTYNKIKHGFVIVVRMDVLIPGEEPATDWKNDVNVLSGIDTKGNISFTAIERSVDHMEQFVKVIKMCGDAWAELASLVIWLWEHNVPL